MYFQLNTFLFFRSPLAGHAAVRVSTVKLIPAVLCRVKESGVLLLLVAPFWPSRRGSRSWFVFCIGPLGRFWSGRTCSLSFRARSGILGPRSGSCVYGPSRATGLTSGLPAEVQENIASARAPSTRKLYTSKWKVFESWCLAHAVDPVSFPIGPVQEFMQEKLAAGAAATTVRVYFTAIAARKELDEIPLGRHRMVSAFMHGAWNLRPVHPIGVPSWDLTVVLEGLMVAPAPERILTLKVTLCWC